MLHFKSLCIISAFCPMLYETEAKVGAETGNKLLRILPLLHNLVLLSRIHKRTINGRGSHKSKRLFRQYNRITWPKNISQWPGINHSVLSIRLSRALKNRKIEYLGLHRPYRCTETEDLLSYHSIKPGLSRLSPSECLIAYGHPARSCHNLLAQPGVATEPDIHLLDSCQMANPLQHAMSTATAKLAVHVHPRYRIRVRPTPKPRTCRIGFPELIEPRSYVANWSEWTNVKTLTY